MAGNRGGKRPGAGRPSGSRSAATKEMIAGLSELARTHTEDAITCLVKVMKSGESEAARVTAANSILDRAYGKPVQALDHSSTDGTMSPEPALDVTKLSTAALTEIMLALDANRPG